jgi:ankyrin repeat protein
MSDDEAAATGGDEHTLDSLRREAKRLLKQARSGDPVLLARLRAILPRLAALSDEAIKAGIKLADIQHGLARVRGYPSWRVLKEELLKLDPTGVHAGRLLGALREGESQRAHDVLVAHPEVARYSIHTAAALGDVEGVARFLAEDRSLAVLPSMPGSVEPIIFACHAGLQSLVKDREVNGPRTVEMLLDAGASPNAFIRLGDNHDLSGIPALYFAVVSNNLPVVRLLLERGANPNDGESVYHGAELNHRECLELLLQFGADLSSSHVDWGNTPLYFIAGYREGHPNCASSELGMRWLLEHGADPNVRSGIAAGPLFHEAVNETPLHRIAANGRSVEIARMLVEHGAEVDARRRDGRTAYALAMRAGNIAVARYLAENGADTDNVTNVDRLLAALSIADVDGTRALIAEDPGVVATLTEQDRELFQQVVADGKTDSVRLMLSLGWDLKSEHHDGGTPLHWAAWHGRPATARLLLEEGAPVNVRDSEFGSSPLAWASHGSVHSRPGNDDDYMAVVDMLLDAGAQREMAYNRWGEPPERLASPAVAALLRRRGFAA